MHHMAISDPDLNLLVALRALLEEANVTRAGERIGMGQSTMSSALSRLRAVFQDELLVRIGRDYELTPLAHQLLPQVQLTLPLVAQALGQLDPFDPATARRRFKILLTDYAAIELQTVFAMIVAAGSGLAIDLRRLPTEPLHSGQELLAHDFIVTVPGSGVDAPNLDLFIDEYVVVADRDNPLVADGTISLEGFLASPHVRCDFGRAHTTPAERRMLELDLHPEVRATTSTMLAIPSIISGTRLIGVAPRRMVERAGGSTIAVPTPFSPVPLVERLWWHQGHTYDPGHQWFRELIAGVVRSGALLSPTV